MRPERQTDNLEDTGSIPVGVTKPIQVKLESAILFENKMFLG